MVPTSNKNMKVKKAFILMLSCILFSNTIKAQCSFTTSISAGGPTLACGHVILTAGNTGDVWTQKSNFGNGVRYRGIAFSIGTKGYMGTGTGTTTYMSDFWEYDPSNNTWSQKANYAGGACYGAVGFASSTKGYVGTGFNGSYKNDFYEYDPVANTWTQKANFGGTARALACGFFVNGKCYIGTGLGSTTSFNDLWEYDPSLNFWSAKASVPSSIRYNSFGAGVGNSGFIGGGYVNNVVSNDVWEYSATSNTWTQRANLGTNVFYGATALNIGGNLYVATGIETAATTYSDKIWRYDVNNNNWTQMQGIGSGQGRYWASSFAIGLRGYVVGGYTTTALNTTWEYEAPGSYSWSSGFLGQVYTPTVSGNYSVLITNASGCTATAVQAVSISPNPIITVTQPSLVCSGNSYILSASGASSYTWSANAGGGNSNSVTITPSVSVTYTVSGTTGTCTVDYPLNLLVNTSPNVSIAASGPTLGCGVLTLNTISSGNSWTQMASMTISRAYGVAFSIGLRGYVGTGINLSTSTYLNDFWEYNPTTNAWTQKANFGGAARSQAVGFSIGNKGYIGTGYATGPFNNGLTDFWEYDPITNIWTAKTNLPALGRYDATGFSIGNKGYIGTGYNSISNALNDFWEYSPTTNSWTAKSNFGGPARNSATGFSINNLGYIGLGIGSAFYNDFWEYNPTNDTWAQKANFPGTARENATGFAIANKGYIGTGGNSSYFSDFWEYDQITNSWLQKTNFAGNARSSCSGFSLLGKGYLGFGIGGLNSNDLWQFDPNQIQWSTSATVPSISVSNSGIYSVTVTAINGCSSSSAITVSLSPNPTLAINQPSLYCTGVSNTLIANGATSYTWSANAGGANSNSIVVSPTSSIIYTVSGTTGSCTVSQPISVFVYDSPTALIAISGSSIGCGSITFSTSSGGDNWTQKVGLNSGRRYGVSFTIGSKGYVGTGSSSTSTYLNDFWEYDPINNSWTQKANFGGTARFGAAGFSIGNKGYIGTGYDGAHKSDFWEYDPASNLWTQKANYSFGALRFCAAFSIGSKGYFGLGTNSTFNYTSFFEYDPSLNTWTSKSSFGGSARYAAACFSFGGKGYVATGIGNSSNVYNDMWEYDQSSDTWTQKASLAGGMRYYASGFSIGNLGFIVAGYNGSSSYNDVWEYKPATNTWQQRNTGSFGARYGAQAFVIGVKAYLTNGYSLTSPNYPNDLWQYSPINTLSWSNSSTLQATPFTSTGSHSLTVTNLAGCTANGAQSIFLSPNPTISVSVPTLICAGASNTISASGANTYTWSSNAGAGNTSSVVINPSVLTTYTVSGTTGTCTVNYPVVINITPTPNSLISVNGSTTGCGPRLLSSGTPGNIWTQRTSMNQTRYQGISFSIANKGYVGLGNDGSYLSDFWEYDPITNAWTQKANFAGGARGGAVGFSIGNFGYVGTGYTGSVYKNDFWQYNPNTNTWTQKANFGGAIRFSAVGFTILNKGYIGTGNNYALSVYYNDFWEYDPTTDTWTQKANLATNGREGAIGFGISNKGYIGLGYDGGYKNDFWEYSPSSDSWLQKSNFSGSGKYLAIASVLYGRGYVGTGYPANLFYNDFWEYDPSSDSWTERAAFVGPSRHHASCLTINGKIYLGVGYNSSSGPLSDFWEYTPPNNYIWSNSATTQTTQVLNSGIHSVTVTNSGGCASSSAVTLSLSLNPVITITGSNTACSGQNNTLVASGATTYTWSANAGGGNSNSVVITPTSTTTYSISGTTGSCTITDPIVVIPKSSPNSSISVSGPTLGCGSLTLSNTNAGNTWVQKTNITGNRGYCISFSINGKAYVGVGGGYSPSNDLWEFDPDANTWTQKSNFPGTARKDAFAFTLNNLGYVGGGTDINTDRNDFYQYNPLTNTWTQLANYPLISIARAAAFSVGNKGYVGTGRTTYNSASYTNLFYEYDPSTNIWTQKTNFGGTARIYAVGFSIGSKGYITTGQGNTPLYNQDLWEYDPLTDNWTQKANMGGGSRAWSTGFSIGNYGFVCGGTQGSNDYSDLWEYNQATNTWIQRLSHPGGARRYAVGFSIGGRGYIGTGYNINVGNFSSEFYEYTPINTYSWSTGSTIQAISVSASNNYSLTMSSLGGCVSTSVQAIALSPNPTVSVVGNSSILCAGSPYTLQVSGAGSYTWSANAASSNSNIVIVTPTTSTTYTITGATGSCAVNVPVTVTVNPTAFAAISFSSASCGSPISLSTASGPGNTWTQKASITGTREMAFSMVIGSKAYVGSGYTGSNYLTTFWEYDPVNNVWTQKANFAGTGRMGAAAFSINGKGYVGTGYDGSYKTDFWEYDPNTNTWAQKAAFAGNARYMAVGFAIGAKGYFASGYGAGYFNDIYEYDPITDSWAYKTFFSSNGRFRAVAFVINNKAYIGLGYQSSNYLNDLWEYNPANNTVTQKANIVGASRYGSTAFAIHDRGFVGGGYVNAVGVSNEFWEYNATSNTWQQRANFVAGTRHGAIGFAINNKGYLGTGSDAGSLTYNDLWEYNPANTYTWSSGSTLQAITATVSGSYSVTTNNIFGCGSSATQSITIGQNPTISISGPSLVCAGTSVTLNVSGANGYSWSANAANSTSSVVILNPTSSTTYTVIGANGACTTTATKAIAVNALPIVGANASSLSICAGNTLNLFGSGAATYTWSGGVSNNSVFTPGSTQTYTVSGTDFNQCSNSSVVTVTVNPIPVISVNSGSVCSGLSFTLNPGGAQTYVYSSGSSIVSPTVNTTYSVTGTSSAGCLSAAAAVASVVVLTTPTISIGSGSICAGQSFTLNPGGADTYSYSGGNSVVSPNTTSSYTVSGTNNNGCSNLIPAVSTITVYQLPVITAPNGTICNGNSFTISPAATGGGAVSYTYSSGSAIVSPGLNTSYSVTGTSSAGCVNTNPAVVNVLVNPIPTISINSGSVCSGLGFVLLPSGAQNYTFSSVFSTVFPTSNSTYSVTGTSSAGCLSASPAVATVVVLTTPTLTVNSGSICEGQSFTLNPGGANTYSYSGGNAVVAPNTTSSYTISGTGTNGCTNLIPVVSTVTVFQLPLISMPNGTICIGNSFTLNPSASGGGAVSYTYSSGSPIVSPNSTSTYSVIGTSSAGCANNNPVGMTLFVNPLPTISVNSGTICSGLAFTLTPAGAQSYTYSSGSAIVFPTTTNTYSITGTSSVGCVSAAAAVSTVNVLVSPTITVNNGTICAGNSFSINPGGASIYNISGGNAVVSPTQTSSYTITGTASNGCNNLTPAISTVTVFALPILSAPGGTMCFGNTFTINPTSNIGGVTNYSFSSGSATVSPAVTSSYSVVGTSSAGCTSASPAVLTVSVSPLPTITVNGGLICNGLSFTLNPTGAQTYTFSGGNAVVSPNANTTYSVSGTSSAGCLSASPAVASVTVLASPTVVVNSGSICSGQSFTINPGGANTYVYTGGNAIVSPNTSSSYSVTGTATNGCSNLIPAVASVTVYQLPVVSAPGGSICLGNSFTITPTASGGGAVSYTYSGGSAVVSPGSNTAYSVTATSSVGCMSATAAIVNVSVVALPTISLNSGTICDGQSFTLNPTGAQTYTFSGGNAVVSPNANTTYSVSGTSSAGCLSASPAVASVTVLASPTVVVNSGSICSGQSFTLNPGGANTYVYTGGNAVVSPNTSSSYSVTGTATNGCSNLIPAVASVTVYQLPVVSAPGGSICLGNSFTITPAASGGGAVSYTYSGGSAVVSPGSNTAYSVTATSSVGCMSANAAIVNVSVIALPTLSVNSGTICIGQSFTLNPAGAQTYTFSGGSAVVSPSSNTTYTVLGTSTAGCVGSKTATVAVQPSLTLSITGPTLACSNETIVLNALGSNSYTWNNGSTTNSIIVSPSVSTNFTVTSVVGSCSGTASQFITINPNPTVTVLSSNTTICADESLTLTANGANTYTWYNGATDYTIVLSPSITATYSVAGSDLNGCSGFTSFNQIVDPCLSILAGNLSANSGIFVFPNPNNGETYLELDEIKPNSTIELYNYLGQLVLSEKIFLTKSKIDFKHLANGLYTLEIISNGKLLHTSKIIKN